MFKKLIYLATCFVLVSAVTEVVQADLAGWDAVISDAGPLHWYKFDETGTDCIDSGSGGLDGVYEDVTVGQDGFFGSGQAVEFTRTGANRANFGTADDLPGPWTVEYVVMTTKPPAGSDAQCLHDSPTTSIRLAGWTATGEAGFTLYGVADYVFTPVAGLTINDLVIQPDVWRHLVWRNDGTGTQLFFDGELVATTTDMIDLPRLTIGGRSGGTSDQFQGFLDEAVVFDRALTDDEIFTHASKTFPLKATNPNPEDGALYADTWANLSWTAGSTAASHDVYLSDNFADVNDGTGDAFRGNQTATYIVAGFPGFPYPDGLVPGTTYYWRIDEVEADGTTKHKGDIWSFTVPPKMAYDPSPANGAEYVAANTVLNWTPGFGSKLHTVYFGTSFEDVNNATGGLPLTETTYDPGPLEKDMTYYWRVDEFDGVTTHKGEVWSFSTIPTITVTDPTLMGWWKLDEGSGNVAVDWSGHDNHGTLTNGPQWVVGYDGQALEMDGTNWVDCGSDDSLAITGPLTITCWVNPGSLTGDRGFAGRNGAYAFKSHGTNLRFTTPGILDHDAGNAILEMGTWQHVAAT
ncbi:MAG: LamG domain-containing protein, partial [Sedimentisphaerales bacterium]